MGTPGNGFLVETLQLVWVWMSLEEDGVFLLGVDYHHVQMMIALRQDVRSLWIQSFQVP